MQYGLIAVCGLAFFVFGFTASILGPTVEDLALTLGVSVATIGILRSSRQVGQFMGFLVLGRAADRYDLRKLALGGAVLMAAGLYLVAHQGLILAVSAAVLWGIGHSTYNLAPNVVVPRVFKKDAASVMTALHGIYGIGAIAGPLLVETLRPFRVENLYSFSALLAIAAGVAYVFTTNKLPENHAHRRPNTGNGQGKLPHRELLPFTLGILLFSGANFGVADWLYYYAQQSTTASSSGAALALSAFWLAMTVARFAMSYLLSHFGEALVVRSATAIAVLGSVLLSFPVSNILIVSTGAILIGIGLAPLYPVLVACAPAKYPELRGAITGHLAAAAAFGSVTLPVLQGWLSATKSAGMLIVLLATVALLFVVFRMPFEPKKQGA